jgi:N-acetylmuramoyl-L-alanine amidase
VGFLSNPAEDRLLASPGYEQRAAQGLERGIRAFVAPRR